MILWLAELLEGQFSWLNLFGYQTFRAIMAALTALFLSLFLGPWFIRKLQIKQIGQQVRSFGPESHLSKQGTPTMGGAMILAIIIMATLLWSDLHNHYVWLCLYVLFGFGLVGWIDDYRKLILKDSAGLAGRWKYLLQSIFGITAVVYLYYFGHDSITTQLVLPLVSDFNWNLGWLAIPLGYFGGLGAASKNGILFKGATFLDQLSKINTLVMDKTGTVTKGVFKIKEIKIFNSTSDVDFMKQLMAIESKSTHPIAKAIMEYDKDSPLLEVINIKEIAGKGLTGTIEGKLIAVGNGKLMEQFNISTPSEINDIVESIVLVSIDGEFAGYVTIADELKEDAKQSIRLLRSDGIKEIIMLSGDKDSITQQVAKELNIEQDEASILLEKFGNVRNAIKNYKK